MKVVIAMDSMKGSLSSPEAGHAIREGILRVFSDADVCVLPLADGGEGTVMALTAGMHGHLKHITVSDPLGRPVTCEYGIIPSGMMLPEAAQSGIGSPTAIIEMAGAAGITLLAPEERNPLYTTTYGVGEVIMDAIARGCRNFIIGIGGSATNDGGIGMLQALGFDLLDENGLPVPFGAIGLEKIVTISDANVIPELKNCTFRIACDVKNTLCGENGCSAVFGPQKGATLDMIVQMDQWLQQYANLCERHFPNADSMHAGTGAAGGLGFAFLTFMNATLESGIQIILDEIRLKDYIKDADIVITGEGRLDGQTIMGKAPIGVAQIAKQYKKTVLAFSGCVTDDATVCNAYGIDAFFPILRECMSSTDAMESHTARKNLTASVEQVFRLIKAV